MKISEAKDCIKELYLQTGSVTALISERGVGKTSAYKQCAEELGIGYINLYAAALEGPDFMGLPDKDRENMVTVYLAPQFLPTVQAVEMGMYPEKGILVLEEINRVPSDTVSVLYPLLLEKKVNGHALAKGWTIGVTMNPDTMNYLVNSLDDAMIDRFISIEVNAELEDYVEYSLKNNPNDEVLAFLQACPDMLLVVQKAANSTALLKYPTPRGWTKVQELLNHCRLEERLMHELIAGIVGSQAASSFYGFRRNKDIKIPATRLILDNYDVVSSDIDELVRNKHIEVLNYVIKKLVMEVQPQDQQVSNINRFIENIPQELQILFFKYMSLKRPEVVEFFIAGSEAIAAISDRMIEILCEE